MKCTIRGLLQFAGNCGRPKGQATEGTDGVTPVAILGGYSVPFPKQLLAPEEKSAVLRDGNNIAGTMQDADNDDFFRMWKVMISYFS